MSRTIKAWSLCIVWSDDTEETHTQVPQTVATAVDQYCDDLEGQELAENG